MQEKNSQQVRESGKETPRRFTIWGVSGCCLIVAALVGILLFYCWMPMHVNRDLSDKLPWQQGELIVEQVDVSWRNAEGNKLLAKRTHLYPEARVVLGKAPGKGRIDVIFLNPEGTQVGDTHFLRYENGQFEKRDDRISRADGKTATVWLETGYESADIFELHRMNMEENLWRVVLIHRTETVPTGIRLGQRSIKAEVISEPATNEQE